MKRSLKIILPALLAAALIGCAAEPNDFPPRPTDTPGAPALQPTAAVTEPASNGAPPYGGLPSSGVIVSTSPGGEGTAVAPPAPSTEIVGGSGAANGTAADLTEKPGTPAPMTPQVIEGSGQLDVTMADNGSTLVLTAGQSFVLKLSASLKWNVSIADPSIISQAQTFAAIPGAQGMYVAQRTGQTELSAVGTAICAPGQMCPMFVVLFKLTIVVK